jgi:hypothetical protein
MGGTEMEQAEELRRKLRALGKFAVVSSIHRRFALDAHAMVHVHTLSFVLLLVVSVSRCATALVTNHTRLTPTTQNPERCRDILDVAICRHGGLTTVACLSMAKHLCFPLPHTALATRNNVVSVACFFSPHAPHRFCLPVGRWQDAARCTHLSDSAAPFSARVFD